MGPVALQAAIDSLGPPWVSADLIDRVALDQNRHLWIFGDTFRGQVGPAGDLLPDWSLVNSSAVLQVGGCFKVVVAYDDGAWIPAFGFSEWMWPQEALVHGEDLYVFAIDLKSAPDRAYGLGFEQVGGTIAVFDLQDLRMPYTLLLEVPDIRGNPFGWGALMDEGWVYLYAHEERSGTYVARLLPTQIHEPETWTFWDGTQWGPDVERAASVSQYRLRVFRQGERFGAVAVPFSDPRLHVFESATPIGPWELTQVVELDSIIPDVACYAYEPLVVEPVIMANNDERLTVSVNFLPRCMEDTLSSIDSYGPRFISVDVSD